MEIKYMPCESNFGAVLYKLRILWTFVVDIIALLIVLVQCCYLLWELFYGYDNFVKLILPLVLDFILVIQWDENIYVSHLGKCLKTAKII